MEKIVAGVPYEISIEPSVDIGKFKAEIIIFLPEYNMGVNLEPIKGEAHKYSFIIPSAMKSSLSKKASKYTLYVYKENARFEVDKGTLQFIDEGDFVVDDKDGKMKRTDGKTLPKTKVVTTKKPEPKPTSTPTKEIKKKPEPKKIEPVKEETKDAVKEVNANEIFDKSIPDLFGKKQDAQKIRTNLQSMLKRVEERNEEKVKRDKINENIQKAIRQSQNNEDEQE